MMTMLKRIVCLMVSCVFISMVCIPAAHADNTSGSIDLNVQPSPDSNSVQALNNDGDASGKAGAEPFNPCKQVSSYTLSYESYMTDESRLVLEQWSIQYMVFMLLMLILVCRCPMCMYLMEQRLIIVIRMRMVMFNRRLIGALMMRCFEQREWWRNDTAFKVYSPDGYNTPVVNISCNESLLRELKDCHAADSTLNAAVFVDSRKLVGTVLLSKHYVPPEPVLTSFPMTGKYALTIVISLVLIAGISMVFIHRYGRK